MAQPVITVAGGTGGQRTAAIYSGQVAPVLTGATGAAAVGSDVILYSGPGRLNSLTPHQTYFSLSGVQLNLYDSTIPVSGGPNGTSGHIPLGGLGAAFGVSGQIIAAGAPIPIGTFFNSGLCLNSRSGQPGVTISYSPEKPNPTT